MFGKLIKNEFRNIGKFLLLINTIVLGMHLLSVVFEQVYNSGVFTGTIFEKIFGVFAGIYILSILAVNFIFMPTTWTLFLFIIIHIIGNSEKKILLNIFRLILGIGMVFFGYFCLMYILGFDEFNWDYIPFISNQIISDFSALYVLFPILFFCVLAVLDHFINFNKKSPANKYKYAFILIFLLAQCLTLVFYMGHSYEYFLLVMLPISIIVSRFLRLLNKPWLQEVGLWIIVLSCIVFKFRLLLVDFIL